METLSAVSIIQEGHGKGNLPGRVLLENCPCRGDDSMKPKFLYDDLRGWIDEARKLDEVRDVEGATWQEEIGMATELLHHSDPAPAAL